MDEEQYILPEEYDEWEEGYYGSYDDDYDYFSWMMDDLFYSEIEDESR